MEVIYLRMEKQDKDFLAHEAERWGMKLNTYCRMILKKHLLSLTGPIRPSGPYHPQIYPYGGGYGTKPPPK
jgi:hypothetical protein